jgi:tetratricopeptide (TPR) repeat protein
MRVLLEGDAPRPSPRPGRQVLKGDLLMFRLNGTARAALRLSTLMFAAALISPEACSGDTPWTTEEDSVLIVTRQALSDTVAADETLAPTAADSDRKPDLADETDEAVPLDKALAEVARDQQSDRQAASEPTAPQSPAALPAVPAFQPAKFNGIQPGTSTRSELIDSWGEPAESISTSDGAVLTYHTDPFEAIDVLISSDDVVAAVKISLAESLRSESLARRLSLDKIEALTATDLEGKPVGQSFPERSVLFMFDAPQDEAAEGPTVSHIVIQPLDAKAFTLRAEQHLHGPYGKNIRDLRIALSIDPQLSVAHWLLSEIYLMTGQADLADAAITKALELEPNNGAYQLRKAQVLDLMGQYDEAVQLVRAVLDREDVPPMVKAQALHEMARLASLGSAEIADKAVSFENKAIEIADHLATSKNVKERRAAKQVLVEAHVSMAGHVARQSFDDKLQNVGEWFGRASGLAEDFIANDGGGLELRLLIAREALTALASFKSTGDPAPWIAEAEETAKALLADCDDPLWQKRIQWELGTAYLQALKIEHSRRETEAALRYSSLAIENLAEGAKPRQAVHSTEQLVGQLYFYIGAVHAIHKQDHRIAAKWYNKAVPLLTATRPPSELYSPRREGEELVSMGVTYWQVGQKDRALELTQAGAVLVEVAVEDGIAPQSALAVPYGNLAAIYDELGQAEDATKYAKMAKSADSSEAVKPAPRTTSAPSDVRGKTTGQSRTARRPVASDDTSATRGSSTQKSVAAAPQASRSSDRTPRRFDTARAGGGTTTR